MAEKSPFDIPFDELPNPKQVWVGKPGSREEGLGKLAILTPEVVARAAATEIKTGRRVTMGWDLNKLELPNLNRQPCEHKIVPLLGGIAFDDIYTFNPRRFFRFFLIAWTAQVDRLKKNRVVSGMGSVISPRRFPGRARGYSTVVPQLRRSTTVRMIGLACSTGLEKELQVGSGRLDTHLIDLTPP